MPTSSARQGSVRAPKQARSQQRVQLILDTAKALIATHGCAGLKMTDIAAEAGVSIGSIYQYYPNKQAIVAGLAKHYLDGNHRAIDEALATPPESIEALSQVTAALLEGYYEQHLDDPVLRDVWMGSATDKEFHAIDLADTQRNVELIFERSKHLFNPRRYKQVKLALLMNINLAASAVTTAAHLDSSEARTALGMLKAMHYATWNELMMPLAR